MRALAYLLGARALDLTHDADRGIRWPKPETEAPSLATTPATAAAWRRWRDGATTDAQPQTEGNLKPALKPTGI